MTGTDAVTDLERHIAQWWPKECAPVEPVPVTVELARTYVAAAGPRHAKEATTTLRYCHDYLTHRSAAGQTLDADVAFDPATVDHYRDHVLTNPKGTRDAIASHLKRLHPGVGLGGTTRSNDTADTADSLDVDAEQAQATETVPIPAVPAGGRTWPAALAPDVAAAIAGYRPGRMSDDRWDPVAELCRYVVATYGPTRPARATNLCREAAYLAGWTHTRHRALRPEVVFAAANIEAFLDVIAGAVNERTAATFAANLHALREGLGLPLDVPRRRFPAPDPKGPYEQAEIDAFYAAAARVPTAQRRRHLSVALDLLFGAGATPADATWVEPDQVVADSNRLTITFAGRTVPVLDDHADSLLRACRAARLAGDRFLIGGRDGRRHNRFADVFAPRSSGRWGIDVDATRARATWIVDAANDLTRFDGLVGFLDAAGLETCGRLTDLLPHLRARHAPTSDTALDDTLDRLDGCEEQPEAVAS